MRYGIYNSIVQNCWSLSSPTLVLEIPLFIIVNLANLPRLAFVLYVNQNDRAARHIRNVKIPLARSAVEMCEHWISPFGCVTHFISYLLIRVNSYNSARVVYTTPNESPHYSTKPNVCQYPIVVYATRHELGVMWYIQVRHNNTRSHNKCYGNYHIKLIWHS
jgi:hypothetical protein